MLLKEAGSAKAVWQMSCRDAEKLMKPLQYRHFSASRVSWELEKEYGMLEKRGIRFIPQMHPEFPEKLKDIPDPPVCLYVRGKLPDPQQPSVAIIGARMCSEYGRYLAREFGMELAGSGIQIISGMAGGVDGISQKGAVMAGGTSYAVMGCGVDCCYPPENRDVYDLLRENGGIISEYAPGTQPKANLFPPRNRIISGLADLVLVIEARKHSGTLITVDMALEQGRDVWAVPGRITDRLSDGCNQLIRQGAGIALSPKDLLQEFYGLEETENVVKEKAILKLTPMENALMNVLDLNLQTISQLYEKMAGTGIQVGIPELMNELVQLCIKGMAQQEGSCFRKRQ
jgi:DNA processing protein